MSDWELVAEENEQEHPQQNNRGPYDALRDVFYGAIKGGLWEPGKFLGNIATGGNLEKIPGYKQYIPFVDKLVESIQSPNKSPGGESLKIAGEFALPVGGAARLGYRGFRAGINALPPLTRRGLESLYENADRIAGEEGVQGLVHPRQVVRQTENFLEGLNVPVGQRLEHAVSGQYGGARDIKNVLGQLSRSLPAQSGERIGASNLRSDWINSILRGLEEGNYPRTLEATQHAESEYARSQRLKNLIRQGSRHATGLSILDLLLNRV